MKKLIAGPSVFICDECIDLCNEIIRDEAAATDKDATDKDATDKAAKQPAAPTPRGGRGIDGATQIINRDNLPSAEDLEDLDDIDPLSEAPDAAETDGTEPGDAEAAPPAPARLGPSDSATTVIRRSDLPDAAELAELKALLPPAEVEYVEKQPTLEEVFLSIVGTKGA